MKNLLILLLKKNIYKNIKEIIKEIKEEEKSTTESSSLERMVEPSSLERTTL